MQIFILRKSVDDDLYKALQVRQTHQRWPKRTVMNDNWYNDPTCMHVYVYL